MTVARARRLFATLIVAVALLLTSYNGSLNWLLLLVFAAILMPGWKPLFRRWLEHRNHCDHKERDE